MGAPWRAESRRSLTVGACTVAVAAAHGVALVGLVGSPPGRLQAASPVTLRVVAVPAATVGERQDLPTRAAAEPPAPVVGTAVPPPPAARPIAPAVVATASSDTTDRFWRFSEVDEPAEPEGDWALTLDALDGAARDRVGFDLWIDARGRILACTLLGGDGLTAEQQAAIQARLMATVLRPAVRGGVAVASFRRIEIYVEAPDATASTALLRQP